MKLTQSELLAMPESEYMNDKQLLFFEHLLLQELSQLVGNYERTNAHMRELELVSDPADRATQEESQGLELRTRDRERKHIKSIKAALTRIKAGSYGYCEQTGEPIGLQRLIVRPTTKLCLEAQEQHELRERQYNF